MKSFVQKSTVVIGGVLFFFVVGMNFVKLILIVVGGLLGASEENLNGPFVLSSIMIASPLLAALLTYHIIARTLRTPLVKKGTTRPASAITQIDSMLGLLKKTLIVLLVAIYLYNAPTIFRTAGLMPKAN